MTHFGLRNYYSNFRRSEAFEEWGLPQVGQWNVRGAENVCCGHCELQRWESFANIDYAGAARTTETVSFVSTSNGRGLDLRRLGGVWFLNGHVGVLRPLWRFLDGRRRRIRILPKVNACGYWKWTKCSGHDGPKIRP